MNATDLPTKEHRDLVDQACLAVEPAFSGRNFRTRNELLWTASNGWAPAPALALLASLRERCYRDLDEVRAALQEPI